ncbi:MAG: Na+/H+ antiporter [Solirubrobacterales bacterium]
MHGIGELSDLETLLLLVAVAVLFVRLADLVSIPYPIVLVLVGISIGTLPGAPGSEIPPNVIFLIFLPPLLFSAGLRTSPREMKEETGALGGLVIGLSIVTMVAVAAAAEFAIPWLDWPQALLLGAIVAPTDPVAAIATFTRVGVPQRVSRLVETESMINDSTALVLYRVFLTAVVAGTFSLEEAGISLVVEVAGGIFIGLAIGWVTARLQRSLDDPPLSILLTVVVAYAAYLVADSLGASGVLSAVSAGLYVGWMSRSEADAETRLDANAFWGTFIFALNVLLFILLGLRLPSIIEAVQDTMSVAQVVGYGALISAVVIVVRLAWQFGPVTIGRFFSPVLRFDTGDGWKERLVVGWSGMRGAVSLAAALSLPLTLESGADFENRETLMILTVAVIFATLVLQGLTLPMLIRKIGLTADEGWTESEARARTALARKALDRLGELERDRPEVPAEVFEQFRTIYGNREARWNKALGEGDHPADSNRSFRDSLGIRRELIDAERRELLRQQNEGEVDIEMHRRIERELDLDETKLPSLGGR